MTTGVLTLALMAASAGVNAAATSRQAQAQANMQRFNAALARQQAERTRKEAAVQAGLQQEKTSALLAGHRARTAGRGLGNLGSGSLLRSDHAGRGEFEALSTIAQGAGAAHELEARARLADARAADAHARGAAGIGKSLLGTATDMSSRIGSSRSLRKALGLLP